MHSVVFALGLAGCVASDTPRLVELSVTPEPAPLGDPQPPVTANKRADPDVLEGFEGAWVGTYTRQVHAAGSERSSVVAFTLELRLEQQWLRGRMTEHALGVDDDDGDVAALLEGVVGDDGIVRLTKHYAPSTGLTEVAEVVARHDAVTGRIEGTWTSDGASGRFLARRDLPGPQLAFGRASVVAMRP